MKKIVFLFLVFNAFVFNVYADEAPKKEVNLIKCEDALTSWVLVDGKKEIIRLIATDISDGELNEEIDSYVCNKLNNANKIEIEYDLHYEGLDDYNRYNVWVYVDSILLQEDLIEKGYAQVNYVTGEYLYLDNLCSKQKTAIEKHLGIWNYPNQEEKYCQSGININANSSNELEEEITEDENQNLNLIDMVILDVGVVILALILKTKRRKNGKR